MSCNGKRDHFDIEDLRLAASSVDVRRPPAIIDEVQAAVARWMDFAEQAGIDEARAEAIGALHRCLT